MKWGTCVHMLAGAMMGVAAAAAVGSMDARSRRKLKKFCVLSGRKMMGKG